MKVKLNVNNKKDYHILQVMYETTKLTIKELSKQFNVPENKIIKLKTDHHWFRTKERKLVYFRNRDMIKPLQLEKIYCLVNGEPVELITEYREDISNKNEIHQVTDHESYIPVKTENENLMVPISSVNNFYFEYK